MTHLAVALLTGACVIVLVLMVVVIILNVVLVRRQRKHNREISTRTKLLEQEELQHRRARQMLGEQEALYRTLIDNSCDMIMFYELTPDDLPGRFTEVNEAACNTLCYTREKLLAMSPVNVEIFPGPGSAMGYTRTELVTMSDHDVSDREHTYARVYVHNLLKKKAMIYEGVFLDSNGKKIPVEISAKAVEVRGKPVIMCAARDISRQKAAEQAWGESERRFHDFFSQSPIGVAMYSASKELVRVNQACLRMFGVPGEREFRKLNMFDNPFVPDKVKKTLADGQSVRFHTTFDFDEVCQQSLFVSSRKGKAYYEILITNVGRGEDYSAGGYLVQVLDTTRRLEVESALHQSERQLQQAQKMEAIGTLAGGIAHDFNNILTPIIGYTELALHVIPKEDALHGYMEEVGKASYRAKDLVEQILAFSRRTEPEGRPIRISPIIKEVLKLQRGALPKEIEISSVIKTEHDVVVADPTQVHQIMMNLCTNAAYAMRDKGGVLEVRLTDFMLGKGPKSEFPNLTPGRYLRLSVKDSGTGIDPEVAERIFEPFFTTKKRGEGTGMGLAAVHGIVTSLKGGITVDTEVGSGATFHVVLPAVEEAVTTDTEEDASVPSGNECVLFVDDEPDIGKLATEMFRTLGYQPVVAEHGAGALALFKIEPTKFDLVITDQVMPGMCGTELAQRLIAIRPDLPVIICTGFGERVSQDEARMAGAKALITKPIVMKHLAETMRQVLDESRE